MKWRLFRDFFIVTLNASGGCETAVTSRVRIGWMNYRECRELLRGRRLSLTIMG